MVVSMSDTAVPAVEQMRNPHAAPLGRLRSGMNDDEAERFIDQLTALIACLREDDGQHDDSGEKP
jgi:hypothetical protein